MYNYMYQYRGDIERIKENLGEEHAKSYCYELYSDGRINLVEWNTLVAYAKEYKRSHK